MTVSAAISSQFATALLFAAPLMPMGLDLKITGPIRSPSYIWQTIQMMRRAKIDIECSEGVDTLRCRVAASTYQPIDYAVTGDFTSASYFLAASLIANKTLRLKGISETSEQGEYAIVQIARDLGAKINFADRTAVVEPGRQTASQLAVDVTDCPNIVPTLAVLGLLTKGELVVRGGDVTNYHKCNRLQAVAGELAKLGARIELIERNGVQTGFRIGESKLPTRPITLSAHNDHRLAKAFCLLALKAQCPIAIDQVESQLPMLRSYCRSLNSLGIATQYL